MLGYRVRLIRTDRSVLLSLFPTTGNGQYAEVKGLAYASAKHVYQGGVIPPHGCLMTVVPFLFQNQLVHSVFKHSISNG